MIREQVRVPAVMANAPACLVLLVLLVAVACGGANGGANGPNPECSNDYQCSGASLSFCSPLTDLCTLPCQADSDCAAPHVCWQNGCVIEQTCDPLTNEGCPEGRTCRIVPGVMPPNATTVCGVGGSVGYLTVGAFYSSGTTPDTEPLCRIDHPMCPPGLACLPLDVPLGPVNGVSYSTCRVPCTLGVTQCPSGYVCMVETNAGRPAIASCGLAATDCLGGGVTPFGPVCFTPYPDVCWPSCSGNGDCPAGATCQAGQCVTIPLPCDPFQASKTCGAGRTCVVHADGMGGGSLSCAPSAGATWPAACAADTDCAAGSACTHYGDPTHGICELVCNVGASWDPADAVSCFPEVCASGNPSVICNPHVCVSDDPAVTITVPHPLSIAVSTYGMGACRMMCDPVDPGNACLSSMTCLAFNDPSGALQTDCVAPTAMGMGAGACASSPLACAPGYTCRASDKACVKWCYVGVASSCPTGQTCAAASPAVAIRAVTYGTCQ